MKIKMFFIFIAFFPMINAQLDLQSKLHFSTEDTLFKTYPGLYLSALSLDKFSCFEGLSIAFEKEQYDRNSSLIIYNRYPEQDYFIIPPNLTYPTYYTLQPFNPEDFTELSLNPWGNHFGLTLFMGTICTIYSILRGQ